MRLTNQGLSRSLFQARYLMVPGMAILGLVCLLYVSHNGVSEAPSASLLGSPPSAVMVEDPTVLEGRGLSLNHTLVAFQWHSDLDGNVSNWLTLSTANLSVGHHDITFKVQDNASQWSQPTTLDLHVVRRPIAALPFVYRTLVNEQNHSVQAYSFNDSAVVDFNWSINGNRLNETGDTIVFTKEMTAGTFDLEVSVIDEYGFESFRDTATVILHERPIATLHSVSSVIADQKVGTTFRGSGRDDNLIDNFRWRSSIDGNLSYKADFFDLGNLSVGYHRFFFAVRDQYGAWSQEVEWPYNHYIDDGDGVLPPDDLWPNDVTQSLDSDGDGWGDNPKGTKGDEFPKDGKEWKDTDGDGMGDNSDPLPTYHNTTVILLLLLAIVIILGFVGQIYYKRNLGVKGHAQLEELRVAFAQAEKEGYKVERAFLEQAELEYTKGHFVQALHSCDLAREDLKESRDQKERVKRMLETMVPPLREGLEGKGMEAPTKLIQQGQEAFDKGKYAEAEKHVQQALHQMKERQLLYDSAAKLHITCTTELERAARYINIEPYKPKLKEVQVAFKTHQLEQTHTLGKDLTRQIRRVPMEARPQLKVSFTRDLNVGTWTKVNMKLINDGLAHARDIYVRFSGVEVRGEVYLSELLAGKELEQEVALRAQEVGSLPVTVVLFYRRIYDNREYTEQHKHWYEVGGWTEEETLSAVELKAVTTGDVDLLREFEFYRGYIRVKVAVANRGTTLIHDTGLELLLDDLVFRLDRVEPRYEVVGHKVKLGNVAPGEKRTLSCYLDPHICTQAKLEGLLSYRDIDNQLRTKQMRPKEVKVVCPIFFTPEAANVPTLRNLVEKELVDHQDERLYQLPEGLEPYKALSLARETLGGRDVKFVREVIQKKPAYIGEAWYYGVTKVKQHSVVIRVSVLEEEGAIQLFAATADPQALTGLLAELGRDLAKRLKHAGLKVNQITNITIRDSILNRSTLLLNQDQENGEMEGGASEQVNVTIQDSVVTRSKVATPPEADTKTDAESAKGKASKDPDP